MVTLAEIELVNSIINKMHRHWKTVSTWFQAYTDSQTAGPVAWCLLKTVPLIEDFGFGVQFQCRELYQRSDRETERKTVGSLKENFYKCVNKLNSQ